MAYITKHRLFTTRINEVHRIKFLDHGGYNIHVVPLFFENMFALLFLHNTENNFGKQNQHEMNEGSSYHVYSK